MYYCLLSALLLTHLTIISSSPTTFFFVPTIESVTRLPLCYNQLLLDLFFLSYSTQFSRSSVVSDLTNYLLVRFCLISFASEIYYKQIARQHGFTRSTIRLYLPSCTIITLHRRSWDARLLRYTGSNHRYKK